MIHQEDQIHVLQQAKTELEHQDLKTFLSAHNASDELFLLLNIAQSETESTVLHTKAALLDIINDKISELSLALQDTKFRQGLHDGDILALTSALDRKKKREIDKNQLPFIVQLACSMPEDYVTVNPGKFIRGDRKHNKEVFDRRLDCIKIDPLKIPEGFLQKLEVANDPQCQNFKNLFKEATPLRYKQGDQEKLTYRVVFIKGKLVVFRTLRQILEFERGQTTGEKRRFDTLKYFNTYGNIYAALRSQQYIIDESEEKTDNYEKIKDSFVGLIKDIRDNDVDKRDDIKRKLNLLIEELDRAESFPVMSAKLYQLFNIDFKNSMWDSLRLEGAKNKLTQRLQELSNIMSEIVLQKSALEQLLSIQEDMRNNLYDNFCIQRYNLKRGRDLFSTNLESYCQLMQESKQLQLEPFKSFYEEIKGFLVSSKIVNDDTISPLMTSQRLRLRAYQQEHKIKLGETSFPEFSEDIMGISPDLERHLTTKKEYPDDIITSLQKLQHKENEYKLVSS